MLRIVKLFDRLSLINSDPGTSIVITKDNKFVICESLDRSLHLFDLEKKMKTFSLVNKQLLTSLLVSPEIPLAISRDNTYILFHLSPNSVGIYNFERKELASKLENCVEGISKHFFLKIYK